MTELNMEPAMALALCANFGSVARWREQFAAMLNAAPRAGQAGLGFLPREGTLLNHVDTDPTAATGDAVALLSLDLQALPHPVDVPAWLDSIDWAPVYQRYQAAVHAASEPFGATPDDVASALVLDVRRSGVYDKAPSMIPRAHWCDPADVAQWAGDLPKGRDIVVYCVYGHEVGRVTAMRLRAAGLQARYLQGGIDGWLAAGRPVVTRRAPAALAGEAP